MKSLEEEAEEYADYKNDYVPMSFGDKFNPTTKKDFIAGANSKWVQAEVLKTKIDCWEKALKIIPREDEDRILLRLEDLKQQLKKLEDEKY
jgi:hypothetical protein